MIACQDVERFKLMRKVRKLSYQVCVARTTLRLTSIVTLYGGGGCVLCPVIVIVNR